MARRSDQQKPKTLSPRHKRVIDEYMTNGFKKKAAMLAAGYSDASASGNPSQIFSRPDVMAEIERRHEAMKRKYEINEDWITQRLARIANGPEVLARFRRVNAKGELYMDWTDATQDDLATIIEFTSEVYMEGRDEDGRAVKKTKFSPGDTKGALDSLARIKGMFKDKIDITGEVSLIERLQAGRARARAAKSE